MAVILQLFQYEAHIPRDDAWWINPKLFADRTHIESMERPTEHRALLNLWLESRALRHYDRYRTWLTATEQRAKALELEALRNPPHQRGIDLYKFIATRLSSSGDKWTWRRAQGILEDVSDVLRNAELSTLLDLQEQAKKRRTTVFKEIVQEAMAEGIATAA